MSASSTIFETAANFTAAQSTYVADQKTNGAWVSTQDAYDQLVAGQSRSVDPMFGVVSADPILPAEITNYLSTGISKS